VRLVRQKLVGRLRGRPNLAALIVSYYEGRQLNAARTHWGRRGQEKYTERSALVPFKLTRALGVAQASLQERQAGAISVVSGQPM